MEALKKGEVYGRWTVLEDQQWTWVKKILCRCECGTKRKVIAKSLAEGGTLSCGCYRNEVSHRPRPAKIVHAVNVGDVFGRLTVESFTVMSAITCKCSCGNPVMTTSYQLRSGRVVSCGCYRRELASNKVTPGISKHPLYDTYRRIMASCTDPTAPGYALLGGVGVTMHEPWAQNPNLFLIEVEAEVGPKPAGHALVRKGHKGNFEPGNLVWADKYHWNPPRPDLHIPADRIAAIRAGLAANKTRTEIAAELGLSKTVVDRAARLIQQ